MDLLPLADFHLVALHRGFGRAARAEGRSKATLSRRVADLEASLGLRLLEKTGRLVQWGVSVDHDVEIWVLHASARLPNPKVRAFVDHLLSSFPDQRLDYKGFEGGRE